ncbi:hypothetical protein DFW101_1820 [Solidesulfovibrio carbinoliphilus subsp. oakridgensis]|uniref:Uncharacterized protein n=1 Tax=Solidesulfovibrio carbinoliphilus subsp. oakridgensis TaxID=694327 RepID=G7Q9Z7_9BACT|nr:hypothetical protein [Solidesulfovibrio carbinoliphilus]EHJ47827.1 hypothetical protein DFW101_1820 [Solidesulfovibrio carbinoliphilus subsp. oakridgensis]
MATPEETIAEIVGAPGWDQRVARIRLIPERHGTGAHQAIYAAVARQAYVPHLAPNFAYIHKADFYAPDYFQAVYRDTFAATDGFSRVAEADLRAVLEANSRSLLVFRTITGLTREEFAQSTRLAGEAEGLPGLTAGKIDSMERSGSKTTFDQARVAALTLVRILAGDLFGDPPGNLASKQAKPDTEAGWDSVRDFARGGVPFAVFLHQRHSGGAFRQVLDATSTLRGNLLEEAVETLFTAHGIPHIRTGAHNQAEIAARFEVRVTPAPDFIVYDRAGNLRAMLECKTVNDGGTARDKAPRFARLREESIRLGGVPLVAVLAGMGWTRVNDTLGPVVRDTDGRVFTLANLTAMLEMAPFSSLLEDLR